MQKRRVRRRPARPIADNTPGLKGHLKRFFLSFTPRYFKSYWLSRDGVRRLGKLFGAFCVFVFLMFLWYAKDLPTPGKINARITAQTTKFYDSTGNKLLYELYGNQNHSIDKFGDIPQNIKDATIAIEDKDFYKHGAFSSMSILRAAIVDVTHRGAYQGGSTITQQYVKNALLDPADHSISRKIKELILSLEISSFYSKDDILGLYLNEIPYGDRAYGVESACKTFFPQDIDKSTTNQLCAKNLTLGQSALLAAMANAPTYYSPYGDHIQDLLDRQHMVLDLMASQGYVKQADADASKWDQAGLMAQRNPQQDLYSSLDPRLAHFVLYTEEFLENKYGAATATEGGLKVITTLDYDRQLQAYNAVQAGMSNVRALGGSNAALVSTDPTNGHILAMIGSYDFNDPTFGKYNAALAPRQPGSSFKPIVYATLFGQNKNAACASNRTCPTYGPGTTLYDVPTNFGTDADPYIPQNFGGRSYGILTARQALAGSLNVPAVKALSMAGITNSLQTAKSLGISTLNKPSTYYGLPLVLGSGEVQLNEMANAYESFANGGQHYDQTPILKLYDQKGSLMEDNTKPPKSVQALDPQVAYLLADMLSDNNAKQYIFGNTLALKNNCADDSSTGCVHVAVKTGTTEHYNDAWTIGFTQNIVGAVWVGNNNNAPMSAEAADVAAPIWKNYMNAVLVGQANSAFVKPAGIKHVSLDRTTGRAVTSGTSSKTYDIFPSWYTPMTSADGQSAQIDKISGLLATNCTPDLAKEAIYSSAIQPEITQAENPTQYTNWLAALRHAGYSTSGGVVPTASDNVHSCSDVKPSVNIVGALGGGPYSFVAQVASGTFQANKLQVYFDDQIIASQDINGSGSYPISYAPNVTGSHTFKVVVTDAGLYQTTAQQGVTVSSSSGGNSGGGNSGGSNFTGLNPGDGSTVSSGQVQFSWTQDNGASTYRLYVDGSSRGSTNGTSASIFLTPGSHNWYVKTDTGDVTDTFSFTAQ